MIDPDRRVGPWRLRVWLLILNFVANAVALVGVVRFVERRSAGLLALGLLVTIGCITVLAIPANAADEPPAGSGR